MLPGPLYIYQCPNCENLISRESLSSGNTLIMKLYSDGKRIAPMLPEFPAITICSKCKNIFWIKKAKEIGSYEYKDPVNNEWRNAEESRFLTIEEYFIALDNELFSNLKEELFLRIRIWWGFNDRVRNGEELFKAESEKSLWVTNINKLLELLSYENTNEKIHIAELNRNLGNFDKCMEIIDSLGADFDWLKTAFKNECLNKNDKVFSLLIG